MADVAIVSPVRSGSRTARARAFFRQLGSTLTHRSR